MVGIAACAALAATAAACSTSTVQAKVKAATTSAQPTTSTTAATTTTVAPVGPVPAPLTGLPVPIDQATRLLRPALAVKIDNSPEAMPQVGINSADLVWEIQVESISRLMAVFHSGDAPLVGPIRSARLSDVGLLRMMGRPLFGWSGANDGVSGAVYKSSWIKNVNWDRVKTSDYHRRGDRRPPHNLYTDTATLYRYAEAGQQAPPPLFDYLAPGQSTVGSVPVAGISEKVGTTPSQWAWDGSQWLRWQYGKRDATEDGGQASATNVVIIETPYINRTKSPVAVPLGAGHVTVLTNGMATEGTWARGNEPDMLTITGSDGQPLRLAPGRTWIELTDGRTASVITQAAATALLNAP